MFSGLILLYRSITQSLLQSMLKKTHFEIYLRLFQPSLFCVCLKWHGTFHLLCTGMQGRLIRPGKVERYSCRGTSPTVSTKQGRLALILPLGLLHQSGCCMKSVNSGDCCCYLASLGAVFGTASLMSLENVYGAPGHF